MDATLNQRRVLYGLENLECIRRLLDQTQDDQVKSQILQQATWLLTNPRPQMGYENADSVLDVVSEVTQMFVVNDGVILFHDDDQVSLIDMTDTAIQEPDFVNTPRFKAFLKECDLLDDEKITFLASIVVRCSQKYKGSSTDVVKACVASICPNQLLADFMEQRLQDLLRHQQQQHQQQQQQQQPH